MLRKTLRNDSKGGVEEYSNPGPVRSRWERVLLCEGRNRYGLNSVFNWSPG